MINKKFLTLFAAVIVVGVSAGMVQASNTPEALPSVFIVNNTGDSGDANNGDNICETASGNGICTLRAAMEEANNHIGADIIEFQSSVTLILVSSAALPPLWDTDPTTIRDLDGDPVWIYGVNAPTGAFGFELASSDNKIQGLHIFGFPEGGIVINGGNNNVIGTDGDGVDDSLEGNELDQNDNYGILVNSGEYTRIAGNVIGCSNSSLGFGIKLNSGGFNTIGTDGDGTSDALERNVIGGCDDDGIEVLTSYNTIAGNYIGINADGDAADPNGGNGIKISGGTIANIIGTDGDGSGDAAEKNVISGNGYDGISVEASGGDSTIIAGNFIGTNADGTAAIPNGDSGVSIWNDNSYTRIGTNGDGESDSLERNLISGNGNSGIGCSGDDTTIAGNYIGTDINGTSAIPNGGSGIGMGGSNNRVGTNADGANDAVERNLLSGNTQFGISIGGENNTVAGNYIGTNIDGDVALSNGSGGIYVTGGYITIGGSAVGSTNVVSGNDNYGIRIDEDGYKAQIYNNFIGTDSTGESPLPNQGRGIYVRYSHGNVIGGDSRTRNIISCNTSSGIELTATSSYTTTNNTIKSNYIGVFRDKETPCGNGGRGIYLDIYVESTTIGGTDTGEGNIIAYNGRDGILIKNFAIDNTIHGNMIFENAGLGINLDVYDDEVTPNDSDDSDEGANHLQNYPELGTTSLNLNTLTITGTLTSVPDTKFGVLFYVNQECDSSGHGEGQVYIGNVAAITDGSGFVEFTRSLTTSPNEYSYVTATATDPDGNTSEFSACLRFASQVYLPLIMR